MTLTFDVDDLATRLPEMLAEVEAGHEVVLARGATPIAEVKGIPRARLTPQSVIDEIIALRDGLPRATAEEILDWRDERPLAP